MTAGPGPWRILHINSALTWRGGEQQTLWLGQGLQSRGHQVILACPPGGELATRAGRAGLAVRTVKMRGEWDVWAAGKLARLLQDESIHIVHLHTAHAHTLGLMAAQWAKVPVRILTRRVDFHIGGHPINRWKYGPALTAIVAISEGIRQVLIQDGISPQRVSTVHSGIDLERIKSVRDTAALRKELNIPGGFLVVGMVAALAPHKDHRNFLEAAAIVKTECPDIRYVVVGEGHLRGELERLAVQRGLSADVIFTGFRQDVLELTSLFDIFVLSSYLEGLGTALLDAMALGIPLVATDVGGIPEVVVMDRNGILVPPKDPAALASAIVKLATDPVMRRRLGSFGKEYVRNFSVDSMVTRTEAVYCRHAKARS